MKEEPQQNAEIGKHFKSRSIVSLFAIMGQIAEGDWGVGSDFPDYRRASKKGSDYF